MTKVLTKLLCVSFCFFAVSCATSTTKIDSWKVAGLLPSPEGFAESIGVAGAYGGIVGDFMIVAGGSNFPYGAILEGGAKEFYSDIFVYKINADGYLELVNQGMLPQKLSSGIAVTTEDTLYVVGGENAQGEISTIYAITLNGTKPVVSVVAELPFTWSLGAAVLKDRDIYLIAGRNNKAAVNKAWKFNIDSKSVTALEDLPGEARIQMPFALVDNKIYIFNGLGKLTLSDNYVYDIASDTWTKLTDTTFNNKAYTVAGGAAVQLTDSSVIVLGGVNKEVFDDAVTQLGALKGDELEAFRQDYFNRTPEQFDFSRQQMVYDIAKNQWKSAGTIPFYGGAGPFPLIKKNSNVWHVSGEIKAGIRVPEIQHGVIK